MLLDPYRISSNFRPRKRASDCDVDVFFELFEDFYNKVRAGMNPDLPHKICDPYGFFLLSQDCKALYEQILVENTETTKCKNSLENGDKSLLNMPYFGAFSFQHLLDLLFRGYYFNYDTAMSVYRMQGDALNVFQQIMNGQGYIMNRFAPNKRHVGKLMNFACDSQVNLNEKKKSSIQIPYLNKLCDGKSWPCIISKSYNFAQIVESDTDKFGTGLFVVNDNDNIIDVLKINDLWLTETPLENRLTFGVQSRDYELEPYMKAFSWRSALNAGKILNCNQNDGILVRPCYENYFKTSWFEWSKNSLIYACYINGKLQNTNRKRSKPDYYTLEGDGTIGILHPYEQRTYERVWLDDFDIKEFQQILELKS